MERHQNPNEVEESFIKHFQEKNFQEEIGKLACRTWNETSLIHWSWNTFKFLFDPLNGHTGLLDTARTFFMLLDQIFPQYIEMGIARLMDPAESCGKENASLKNLIDKLESNIEGNLHKEWGELYKQYKESGTKSRRDTVYAHSDLSSDNYNRMERIGTESTLEKIGNLVNNIAKPYSENVQQTSFKHSFDPFGAPSLINTIKEALKYEEIREIMLSSESEDPRKYEEIYEKIVRIMLPGFRR